MWSRVKKTIDKFLYVSILLGSTFFGENVTAQINRFSHIGVENGLSHGWAKCIKKDTEGYLWVGTVSGLNRYNGKEFKVFKNDYSDLTSISDNFIQAIEIDHQNDIWVGTYSGGINKYNSETEKFISYRNSPKKLHSLSDDRIYSIKEDSNDRLWVGTAKGLDIYNKEHHNFNPFFILTDNKPQFIRGIISCIFEDNQKNIWIGSDNGLYKIKKDLSQITTYKHDPDNPNTLCYPYVTSIFQDELGQLWIGTWGGGVQLFDPEQEVFTSIHTLSTGKSKLNHQSVLCLSGDHQGTLYIGTEGGGLNLLNINTYKITYYTPQIGKENDINSNSIHSIYADTTTGITWVGTYGGGLNYFNTWDKRFHHYKQDQEELNNNSVLCITERADGNIYVGTDGGGINIIDPNSQEVSYITANSNNPYGLLSNAILAMQFDQKDNLWVGTFDGGLDLLPKNSNQFIHFTPNSIPKISDSDVNSICITKGGKIWIGTMNGGINVYDPQTKKMVCYKYSPGDQNGVSDNFITHIFENHQGELIIQTGKTLDVFDPQTENFHSFDTPFNIRINTPICSYEDSHNNMWVGTREGLIYFDVSNQTHKVYNTTNGLPNSSISSILEDEQSNLWVSTMGGLVKMDMAVQQPDSIHFHTYTREDGLQGNDFKDMSSHRGKSDKLFFGGQNGMNYFDPSTIQLNPILPDILFTNFKLFNKEVHFVDSEILKTPINQTKELNLDYTLNVFSIDFSATNFWQPNKNQYAYIMEGFEENWNYVGNHNSATYTNLDPGEYVFKVKSANNDGVWNSTERSIKIKIQPPWWEKTWFKLSLTAFSFLIIFSFIRLRLYQLKSRQKELQKEVQYRTEEIQNINELLKKRSEEIGDKNDALTSNNHQLKLQNEKLEKQADKIQSLLGEIQELNELKLRFFTNISHELRTPLTLIIGPIEKLIARFENSNQPQKELNVIHRNTFKLLQLINQLLDFRKIEKGSISLQAQQHDIVKCAEEVFDTFKFMAERKKLSYSFNHESTYINLWFDFEKIDKVITNLLSNAFKYTTEGSIQLSLKTLHDKNQLEISVTDTGTGIDKNQIENIFNLYYQSSNASNLNQAGSGIGLALAKQYVDLHHGQIELSSTIGKGSCFTVLIPLGNQHLNENELAPNTIANNFIRQEIEPASKRFIEADIEPDNKEVFSDVLSDIPTKEKPMMLIVEDNADIRDYIKSSFENDFQIAEASDGLMGLKKAINIIPDLIISDVMMPKMDGFEMCSRIKEEELTCHIPVIMLTAYSGEEKQWEGFVSGADDYVTKPFNIKILQKKMKNIYQTRERLIDKFKNSDTLNIQSLSSKESDQKFLSKAIGIIEEHLSDTTLSVEHFSDQFGMSRRNLLRKLKGITGLSVNEFIRTIRLKKSVELIYADDLNISEIAYQVGFSDPKYYSKCFKSQFGKSPKDYKLNSK